MKNTYKYILLFIAVILCSFAIYHSVGPTDEKHKIGILHYEKA